MQKIKYKTNTRGQRKKAIAFSKVIVRREDDRKTYNDVLQSIYLQETHEIDNFITTVNNLVELKEKVFK